MDFSAFSRVIPYVTVLPPLSFTNSFQMLASIRLSPAFPSFALSCLAISRASARLVLKSLFTLSTIVKLLSLLLLIFYDDLHNIYYRYLISL